MVKTIKTKQTKNKTKQNKNIQKTKTKTKTKTKQKQKQKQKQNKNKTKTKTKQNKTKNTDQRSFGSKVVCQTFGEHGYVQFEEKNNNNNKPVSKLYMGNTHSRYQFQKKVMYDDLKFSIKSYLERTIFQFNIGRHHNKL